MRENITEDESAGLYRRHAAPAAVLAIYGLRPTEEKKWLGPVPLQALGEDASAGHALKMNCIPFGKGSMWRKRHS